MKYYTQMWADKLNFSEKLINHNIQLLVLIFLFRNHCNQQQFVTFIKKQFIDSNNYLLELKIF